VQRVRCSWLTPSPASPTRGRERTEKRALLAALTDHPFGRSYRHASPTDLHGTPDFAVPTLLELVAHGHEIAAVYTRAAKPPGAA